jgi:hypothetical protein
MLTGAGAGEDPAPGDGSVLTGVGDVLARVDDVLTDEGDVEAIGAVPST